MLAVSFAAWLASLWLNLRALAEKARAEREARETGAFPQLVARVEAAEKRADALKLAWDTFRENRR